jgi:hypothetical protein
MQVPELTNYDRSKYQDSITKEYTNNILAYMSAKHPQLDPDKIRNIVINIVENKLNRPQLAQINHPSYGDAQLDKLDLLSTTNDMSDSIVTPSGSRYMKPKTKQSFVKEMIQSDLKQRKIVKNEALDHSARGEHRQAAIKNAIQTRIKIGVNSISGAMNSAYNCLYDPAGYNAITSTARHGCMVGYGHTERFLEGNFYFTTIESIINWIVQLLRVCPTEDQINKIMKQYNLYQPMPDEVVDNFVDSLKDYTINIHKIKLSSFVEKLPFYQLAFIYYACNLKNIIRKNEKHFRPWLEYFFTNPDITHIGEDIDPYELFKLDGDLVTMVSSINPELLENNPPFDTPKDRPDIARKIITISKVFQTKISELQDLFDTFIYVMVDLPNATKHKNMLRKCVIVSDTDSIIFTTKNWVEWYSKGINFENTSFQINALVVYLLTKSLTHTFAIMSMNMGIEDNDLRKISMKNEFLYPVMLRTPMGKHYAGIITQQEGRVYKKPKPDIKGKFLRGSDLCKESINEVKDFLLQTIDDYMNYSILDSRILIDRIVQFEHKIIQSINNKETTYFGTVPIKFKDDYANYISSTYFYYMLWQDVFAEKYGNINIPQKCKVVPIHGKLLRKKHTIEKIISMDKVVGEKLIAFLEKYKNKNITRIIIPPGIDVPHEIVDTINIRTIVYSNASPFYLALRSLGIGIMFKGKQNILSDMYSTTHLEM